MKYCPACKSSFKSFLPGGVLKRPDVKCPVCGCRERYRLLTLFLAKETDFFSSGGRVLEIGPEGGFGNLCKKTKNIEYTSIDIDNELADNKMDITKLKFPDNYFDYIICYHILEHVLNDQQAIQQLYRVLKKDRICFIAIPIDINRKNTFQIKKRLTSNEQQKTYSQFDHVRIYGLDFFAILENNGFKVEIVKYANSFSDKERKKFGLKDSYNLLLYETNDDIYICRK